MQAHYTRHCLWFVCLCFGFIASAASAQNHVLSLDGDGSYVEIINNDELNAITSQVTIEAWIKPTAYTTSWIPLIYKGDGPNKRSYTLWLRNNGTLGLFLSPDGQGGISILSPSGLIAKNKWYHVTGVIDAQRDVIRIFINGVEAVISRSFGTEIYRRKFAMKTLHTLRLLLGFICLFHECANGSITYSRYEPSKEV
ncbi:LamG domain-containing protein [Candidatus Poribacteria bacterium]|nr:LamG domain-containing protein [Candidatus Poribacteria bacterium]